MTFSVKNTLAWIGKFISGGTSGSVLYVDSNGNLAQDNANLFYDASNKRFAIGNVNPSFAFEVWPKNSTPTAPDLAVDTTSGAPTVMIGRLAAAGNTRIQIRNRTGTVKYSLESAGGATSYLANDASAHIVIGGTTANANAILDIQSTTQAVMLPRMTTTQKNAVASPTLGMMVFDTTLGKLSVYGSGATWETVTSV
jgi:hypothetical protein